MSYILDALKKADAERERGEVPGIHAHQVPHQDFPKAPSNSLTLVLWLIAGLLAVILGAMAWRASTTGDPAPVAQSVAPKPIVASAPVTPASQAASDLVATNTTPAQTEVTGKPSTSTVASNPKGGDSVAKDLPSKQVVAADNKEPSPLKKVAPSKRVVRPTANKEAPKQESPPVAPEPRAKVYAMSALPQDIQRELPKLAISGGTYSANPAQRLLIVNNQVFTENSQPVPGITVDEIGQNAAVLRFKGYRYRVAY